MLAAEVPSGSTVNVYTGNPYLNQGILLASFTNSGEYTFDAPKGRNLYFQAVDANGKTDVRTMAYNESNTYNVDFTGNAMAKTKSLGVRSGSRSCTEFAEVKRSTPYATGLWAYISEWYNGASLWDDATTIKKYNNWGDKYYYVADNAQGNTWRDCRAAGFVQSTAAKSCHARNTLQQLRQKAVFHLSFLPAGGKDHLRPEDEPGRARQLYRAAENTELRPVFRQHLQTGDYQGRALA